MNRQALTISDLEEPNRAKRRFTGQSYHFKLLKSPVAPLSHQGTQSNRAASTPSATTSSDYQHGIPSVRTTAPGDEITDFPRLRQKQISRTTEPPSADPNMLAPTNKIEKFPVTGSHQSNLPKHARRFHLTRSLSSAYGASKPTGIRKKGSRSTSLRPPLPTFVERQASDEIHAKLLADNMLHDRGTSDGKPSDDASQALYEDSISAPSFTRPDEGSSKSGVSIHDPLATWNRESDQLADELAALAMEFDPDVSQARTSPSPPPKGPQPELQPSPDPPRTARIEDEYVYETYIRMPDDKPMEAAVTSDISANHVGVLVIDEGDEDLWEGYMENEEDSDWDEEDSNGAVPLCLLPSTNLL